MMDEKRIIELDHHRQMELCQTRPSYRQGRKLTAIKTYTISSESQHLCVYGVPKINLRSELKKSCSNYGQIQSINVLENYKTEIFTECYHVRYQRIQSARIAKRFMDNKSFYGGVLHVCYAPEFESLEETRQKLYQRTKDVWTRLRVSDNYICPKYVRPVDESVTSDPILNSVVISKPIHKPAEEKKQILLQKENSAAGILPKKAETVRGQAVSSYWIDPEDKTGVSFKRQMRNGSKFVPRQVTKRRRLDYT